MEDVIGAHDILCVENIGLTYFRGKLCAEFVQRCVAAVVAGLYFDGGYFFAFGTYPLIFNLNVFLSQFYLGIIHIFADGMFFIFLANQ